jgi:hypothetical protein
MKIKKKEEKKQIYKAFKMFLIGNDFTLKTFCKKFELKYYKVHLPLSDNRYLIDVDDMNLMISLIDNKQTLQLVNKKWVIGRTF